ncbi:MAG: hypothetical protein SRB2_01615 [Desulfobacteraceae bacterium Eth-SRB2]|nr:MAG: hypothetical protein SRB2_01615 [Desulfobacteraceae bacterium Eth-SRB2]
MTKFNQSTLSDLQGQLERIWKALAIGVRNDKTQKRYTYLKNRLNLLIIFSEKGLKWNPYLKN